MTKKVICFLVFWGLIIGSGAQVVDHASAQEDKKMNLRERVAGLKEKAQEKRVELKERVQEKRQEAKNKLEAKRAERVIAFTGRMVQKFEAAIKRLDNLAIRIGGRLDKLSQDGKDVATSIVVLNTAKAKIELARGSLGDAKTALEAVASSETPKSSLESAKEKLDVVKVAVKDAHTALVDVINSIKGSSGVKEKSGSSDNNQQK